VTKLGFTLIVLVVVIGLFAISILIDFRRFESLVVMSAPKVNLRSPFMELLKDYKIQLERMQLIKSLMMNVKDLRYVKPYEFIVEKRDSIEEVRRIFKKELGVNPNIHEDIDGIHIEALGVKVTVRE